MIKNTENTIYVQNQKPYDLKGWFRNIADIIDPGNEKYSKFFYYYSGMLAHDMSTGNIYIWREVLPVEKIPGLLTQNFHYKYKRIDFNYDYTDKYFNFFPYVPHDSLFVSNIHVGETPAFDINTNNLSPIQHLGNLNPKILNVQVYLNGLRQKENLDYIVNLNTGIIHFNIQLLSTDIIIVDYITNK